MNTNEHEWEEFIRAFIREFREFTQIKGGLANIIVPRNHTGNFSCSFVFIRGSEILPITINH